MLQEKAKANVKAYKGKLDILVGMYGHRANIKLYLDDLQA
jgi:hypothetical protein